MSDTKNVPNTYAQNLAAVLSAFFSLDDLKAFPMQISQRTKKGKVAYYVDNRAIMQRLDEAVGPLNWRNEFQPGPGGGILCGLSIKDPETGEWITKWDGAENTDIEAVKGGLSTSMRRAAVQWGIGRYLYEVDGSWLEMEEYNGKLTRFKTDPLKAFPKKYLPSGSQANPSRAFEPEAPEAEEVPHEDVPQAEQENESIYLSPEERKGMIAYAKRKGISLKELTEILKAEGFTTTSKVEKTKKRTVIEAIDAAAYAKQK